MLYEKDNGHDTHNTFNGMRPLPQLTNQHIYASKMKKLQVKYATQIFSNRLASTLLLVSKFGEWGEQLIPQKYCNFLKKILILSMEAKKIRPKGKS
jgi:hypothetical protein